MSGTESCFSGTLPAFSSSHSNDLHCWSPLDFLTRYWRQGPFGPTRAGASHGAFCLGCCWMLMVIERLFCKLKNWRRVATRYDHLARNYLSGLVLTAHIIA
jgi:transposase